MQRLPYRTRLMLAYTAVFAGALVAFGILAYLTVCWSLSSSFAERLAATAAAVEPIPDVRKGHVVFDPDDREHYLNLLRENHIDGATITPNGRPILANVSSVPAELTPLVPGKTRHGGIVRGRATSFYYFVSPINDRSRVVGYILSWQPRTLYEVVTRRVLLALLGAGLAAVLIAIVIGRAVVVRMMRPIVDLNALMSVIEASDLSERVAWEGPDDELGRLCNTFDRLLDRLEAAFMRERRFSTDASHELRTPLSVMRAEVELALSRPRESEAYRETLQRLRSETASLEALIESLLLSSQSDAGLRSELPTRSAVVATHAATRVGPLAAERAITLGVEVVTDADMIADRHLLESATVALLDNAIRFTPIGGRVRIVVDACEQHASLSIVDQGSGFSPAALEAATQRFWRDDTARNGRSFGLGLSIVKAIAERHGGTLVLRNGLDGGIAELRLPPARARVHE